MKRLSFFVCFSLIWLSSMSQQYSAIDSLKNVLTDAQENERHEVLFDLAWEYRKSHPDSTLYYARLILNELPEHALSGEHAKCYNFIGLAYHYKGDDVLAFDFYNKALAAARESGDSIQYAHSLNNMGRMFMYQGDLVRAYDNYQEAFNVFRDIDNRVGMGYAYKSLSELFQTQNRLKKALEMSEKTLELRIQEKNIRGQISILDEMAAIYSKMGNYPEALEKFNFSFHLSEKIRDKVSTARTYLGIAELYFKQDKYDESGKYTEMAFDLAEQSANLNLKNDIDLQLGKTYFMTREYEKAAKYLSIVIGQADKSNDLAVEKEAYEYMSLLHERKGELLEALDDNRRYAEISQLLNSTDAARTIERLEARIEIEKKVRENELLLAKSNTDEAIIDRQRLQNVLLLVTIGTFLIFLIIMGLVYRRSRSSNRKLQEKNKFIDAQKDEIRQQNKKIALQNSKLTTRNETLAALNNEKDTLMNILAHDLKAPFNRVHGLGHLLEYTKLTDEQSTYVRMLFSASDNGLNLIRDLLEVSAAQGENSKGLNLSQIDLNEILDEKAETFRSDAETKHIRLEVISDEEIHISTDRPYLSRILDNLLSNAIKFSPPDRKVILSGGTEDNRVFVSVKDFGQGFTEADRKNLYNKFSRLSARPTAGESSNGLGLAIVKLLVDNMGGEIELISEPGQGSEFIIRFPIRIKERVTL